MMNMAYGSLFVSALLLAVSVAVRTKDETDWPMTLVAHLFWPVTLALIAYEARRHARNSSAS